MNIDISEIKQDFKSSHLNISPIYPDISPIFYRKIKLTRVCHRPDISMIYRSKTDISAIYWSLPISCRTSPISDISEIYQRIYRIFSSLIIPLNGV